MIRGAPSAFSALFPLAAGLALAIAILWLAGAAARGTEFEEFALAEGTTSLFASIDGQPVHCRGLRDAEQCISGWKARGSKPVTLWLGNSQLHAVNQFQQGQKNAPPILHRALAFRGTDLVTFSQPNASLQEHLVLFEYLKQRLPVEVLILAVVFDDLREAGLRPEIQGALSDPETAAALRQSPVGTRLLANYSDQQTEHADLAGLRETVQEKSEQLLNELLDRHLALWPLRAKIRGQLFTSLYRFRNSVFGIDPQTKRPMIPGRYATNFEALEAILDSAATSGITVVVYVVPIRDDVDLPYVKTEYDRFKTKLLEVATAKRARFMNLESLVPSQYWGTKAGTAIDGGQELDFMHFREGGHRILAAKLESHLAQRTGNESH